MATHPHTAQGSSYLPLHTTSTYSARQLTPVASVESTAAAEPNSSQVSPGPGGGDGMPFLPLQARQPRPTTTPSYRPAVLRPTERPCRPSPLTPPQSSSNSVDFELGADSPVPLSRQSTGDSFRRSAASVDSSAHEWVRPYGFGKVTAPPTREHWKPDSSAQSCDAAICNKPFSLFGRRHHCRRCGNVFCGVHSPFLVPLDQDAQFHPDGVLSRACEYCWSDYKGWDAVRLGRLDAVGLGQDTQTLASSATTTTTSLSIGPRPGSNAQIAGSVAGSVPRDWAWSTF
ncbi:MAG: hypothetical protein M1815_001527 [Lichina confinis]|nr:MAG: hypothetical protein M1815_001527 [Lichina confinis]